MTRTRRRTRLWQTATFRLALAFSLIFGIGSAALLFALDISMSRAAAEELEDSLRSQMAIMRADANLEGAEALIGILESHHASGDPSPYVYLVILPDGRRFNAGLPEDISLEIGLHRISVPATDSRPGKGDETMDMLVLADRAQDGAMMAVGRAASTLDKLTAGLHRIALIGGAGLILLAAVAGLVMGAMMLRRLERVNSAAEQVVGGDAARRLPALGFGREFDALVANLNRMLDRLDHTMTALRQVSSDLAHDLRTPLTRLRNTLEEGAAGDDVERAAWAERGISEIDEALGILNALLRIAQVEAADRKSGFAAVDVGALAQTLIDAYRPEAEDSGHRLMLSAEPGLMAVCDAALVKQLLANLIDNALRHTPPGTAVALTARTMADEIEVAVADDGPGVPPGESGNIVKRFYRLDRSRATPGAGLGLTLANAIAELHGHALEIADNRPGLKIAVRLQRA